MPVFRREIYYEQVQKMADGIPFCGRNFDTSVAFDSTGDREITFRGGCQDRKSYLHDDRFV